MSNYLEGIYCSCCQRIFRQRVLWQLFYDDWRVDARAEQRAEEAEEEDEEENDEGCEHRLPYPCRLCRYEQEEFLEDCRREDRAERDLKERGIL